MIGSTSFSRLKIFEQCPRRAQFAFLDKIPEPRNTAIESPLDRGTRVHDAAEKFIRGEQPLALELKNFEEEFQRLKERYEENQERLLLEQMWCYDNAWQCIAENDFANTWLRVKLDACLFLDEETQPKTAVIIDYKTGKKSGNEVKHMEQMQLYQLATLLRFPEIELVEVELWYVDQNETTLAKFKRKHGLNFLKHFNDRMLAMTTTEEFVPRPSLHTCRFCPYKTGPLGKSGLQGTGHCDLNPE